MASIMNTGGSLDLACHTEIEVFFSALRVKKMDWRSESDPFAVLYMKSSSDNQFKEVGRTEVITDSPNPKWTTQFRIDYFFEEIQTCLVKIYDEDKPNVADLSKHDFCGQAQFTLSQLMQSGLGGAGHLTVPIQGGGQLIVNAEEVSSCAEHLSFQLRGIKLKNKGGFFGTSDPFITGSRTGEFGKPVRFYKSPVVMDNLSPTWPKVDMSLQKICNGDIDRPLIFEVWDWDSKGKHVSMGSFNTSVRELSENGAGHKFAVKKDKERKTPGKHRGHVAIVHAMLYRSNTVIDYLRGGMEISVVVGIDYTGSNGNPALPNTLHYVDPTGMSMNQYQIAITSVLGVLQEYDHDKQFPVYGFGGRINTPQGRKVSHCFPVIPEVYAHGMDGVMDAYRQSLHEVGLSGPTLFSQIIGAAAGLTRNNMDDHLSHYTVLLIITDGVINDMQKTMNAIVAAADLPMSIIIVGVGNADFTDMIVLDADEHPIHDQSGRRASRDIVQFVKMNDYTGLGQDARLAKEVVAEIPDQILSYAKMKNISPGTPPPQVDGVYMGAAAEEELVAAPIPSKSSVVGTAATAAPPPPPPAYGAGSYQHGATGAPPPPAYGAGYAPPGAPPPPPGYGAAPSAPQLPAYGAAPYAQQPPAYRGAASSGARPWPTARQVNAISATAVEVVAQPVGTHHAVQGAVLFNQANSGDF